MLLRQVGEQHYLILSTLDAHVITDPLVRAKLEQFYQVLYPKTVNRKVSKDQHKLKQKE